MRIGLQLHGYKLGTTTYCHIKPAKASCISINGPKPPPRNRSPSAPKGGPYPPLRNTKVKESIPLSLRGLSPAISGHSRRKNKYRYYTSRS